MKEYTKSIGISCFLCYADNKAIEFFKKQGFTEEPLKPLERWKEYIRDYKSSKLMFCYLRNEVNYLNIQQTLQL